MTNPSSVTAVPSAAVADASHIRIGATARPVPAPSLPPASVADAGRIRLGATARPAG